MTTSRSLRAAALPFAVLAISAPLLPDDRIAAVLLDRYDATVSGVVQSL